MEFLFQNNIVIVQVGRIAMVFKIILHHLVRDIARTPNTVPDVPKVTAPVSFAQFGKFFLKTTGGLALETFYNIAQLLRRTVFNMYVHMDLAYRSLKDTNIFRITNLLDKIATPYLDIAHQNMETIFRDQDYVRRQPRYRMARTPLFISHTTNIEKCVATESLALKCIVSTNDCDQ